VCLRNTALIPIIGTVSQRRQRLQGELGAFMRQYGRKKHPRHDPNDRGYDRGVERQIKDMDPRELDELLHGDTDESIGTGDCS
jgi:hypothetical protein